MKSLRARINGCFNVRSGAAIALLWASALGQATPDSTMIPEPGVLPLLIAALVAGILLKKS